jgi:hypothetical protein
MTIDEFLEADVYERTKPWRKLLFFAISRELGVDVGDPGPNPSGGSEPMLMWRWIRQRIPDSRLNKLIEDLAWARHR